MTIQNGLCGRVAIGVLSTALSASLASAAVMNPRPVAFNGTALQSYFTSVGQAIDVNTDQKGNALWTTTLSGNSTFTIKLKLGGPATSKAIGLYNDGAPSTHFQIFPATAGPGWFTVTSFDVGAPGHVVSNLFDNTATWKGSTSYDGVNSYAFGFYMDRPTGGGSVYGEDDENAGGAPDNAMNLVYAATGSSVGSWWLSFQAAPKLADGGSFTDGLIFLESVNGGTSPVQPTSWGGLKNRYLPR